MTATSDRSMYDTLASKNEERQVTQQYMSNVNVSKPERNLSIASGLTLIVAGIRRGDLRGFLMTVAGGYMLLRGVTGHCMMYRLLGMNTAVETNKMRVSVPHEQGIHVEASVTVNRPVEEVFAYWRNFENLPQIMKHLEKVEVMEGRRSHWTAKAPAGLNVSWDAEIITERRNELIGWRSLADSHVANAGSVRFNTLPGGQATEIHVSLEYVPPAGQIGAAIARLLGEEPQVQIEDDLKRFKQMMESRATTTSTSPTMNPPGSM